MSHVCDINNRNSKENMKINCEKANGGSVILNEKHKVWSSYNLNETELLYTGITLPNGRSVQFFVNRETGLVVVDICNKKETGGNEVLRINANEIKIGRRI